MCIIFSAVLWVRLKLKWKDLGSPLRINEALSVLVDHKWRSDWKKKMLTRAILWFIFDIKFFCSFQYCVDVYFCSEIIFHILHHSIFYCLILYFSVKRTIIYFAFKILPWVIISIRPFDKTLSNNNYYFDKKMRTKVIIKKIFFSHFIVSSMLWLQIIFCSPLFNRLITIIWKYTKFVYHLTKISVFICVQPG